MKLTDKISWLMGRVQKNLFPYLNECFDAPLTEQEQRLVSILEIVQVEKYASRGQMNHWRGRNPLDRQSMARAVLYLQRPHSHGHLQSFLPVDLALVHMIPWFETIWQMNYSDILAGIPQPSLAGRNLSRN